MNKNLLASIAILVVVGMGAYFFINKGSEEREVVEGIQTEESEFDAKNATFTLDNRSVTLVDGVSETATEGSSAKITTRYFGNESYGDLNFDDKDDVAFIITTDAGGSGTFYYAVAAVQTENGYKPTNAFFIGDRITPESILIPKNSGEIQVNYQDRKPGEPMTAEPSQGKVLLLKVTKEGVLEGLMR